jgi:twitching motility protein PilT
MPLINVNNTSDPKNNVLPNAPFQPVPVNIKPNEVTLPNEVKEYTAPPVVENNFVDEPDIKESLEKKLEQLPQVQVENKEVLPPLTTPEQLNKLQSDLNSVVEQSFKQVPQDIPVQIEASSTVEQKEVTPISNTVEQAAVIQSSTTELNDILKLAINRNASDVHFTVGYRTMIRVDGSLEVATSTLLTPELVDGYVKKLLAGRPDMQMNSIKEMDLTYTMGNRRFRVNIFRQMGTFSITLRVIPEKILSIADLGLPEIIKEFPTFPNGLVLVTGPTGSGKSTTIAAILNQINLTYPKHIVTLEDPIEFVFPKGISLVDQRESGIDFTSWGNALRSILRQDPDVVLVGEMRDLETVEAALQIAETGHLVFATLHTNGAAETVNRVIDIFEANKQDQIRVQLSSVLRAVVSQKLVQVSTGGRKSVVEILLTTPSVKNAIRDKKTFQINNIIQTSSDIGMVSIEKSLVKMVKDGLISKETAKSLSVNPNEIDVLLQ